METNNRKQAEVSASQLSSEGFNRAMQLVGLTGAAGFGLRSLLALKDRFKDQDPSERVSYPSAIKVKMPVRVTDAPPDEEEREQLAHLSGPQRLLSYVRPKSAQEKQALGESPYSQPSFLAPLMMGMPLAWMGGTHLAAILAKRFARQGRQSEEDDAKEEFEKALVATPSRDRHEFKTAGDRLGAALDTLYDRINTEKSAAEKDAWSTGDNVNSLIGGGLGLAGLAGITGGLIGYKHGTKLSERDALDEAMRRRRLRNYMIRPSEIYAEPELVHVHAKKRENNPDAEDPILTGE